MLEDSGNQLLFVCFRDLRLGHPRTDEIADFAELGFYLDLPVRNFSAGPRMCLVFTTSTSIHPDILPLDEGIGAGVAAFLEKSTAGRRRSPTRPQPTCSPPNQSRWSGKCAGPRCGWSTGR